MRQLFNASILIPAILMFACSKPDAQETGPPENGKPASDIKEGPIQWPLPRYLREASGLAVIDSNTLLAHNDEKGNIYRIKLSDRSVVRLASIGKPAVRGDFEGIAFDRHRIFLSTSDGLVLEVTDANLAGEKQTVGARKIQTGAGKRCEIEGLHYLPDQTATPENKKSGQLLLPCKNPRDQKYKQRLVVFSYDLSTEVTSELLNISQSEIPGIKKIHLTAIDATPTHFYIVSASRLIVIDRESLTTRAFKLRKKLHEQIEGIAVMKDGSFLLVEDNAKGLARITYYAGLHLLEEKGVSDSN